MLVTVLTDWISVALHVDRAAWNGATGAIIALLALVTVLVAAAGIGVIRASRLVADLHDGPPGTDWFSDLVAAAELYASWLGPLKMLGVRAIRWLDRRVVNTIRKDPVIAAGGAALVFGGLLALNTLLRAGPRTGHLARCRRRGKRDVRFPGRGRRIRAVGRNRSPGGGDTAADHRCGRDRVHRRTGRSCLS
jgi:hypothetical protein